MIYLVSNNNDTTSADIQKMSVEDSISLISSWPVVQFDTETPGLDPHVKGNLLSMQFGYKDFKTDELTQVVVDCSSVNPKEYKQLIEKSYLVGHNLKFDLQFLYNYAITPLRVYDTMICEQVLYLGYEAGKISFNLHDVLMRHTGEDLDKSMQSAIASVGLSTEEGIRYAAGDVMHLQDIRKSQIIMAEERSCTKALILENRFVPAIAYLEWCGVHLDEKKWVEKMTHDVQEMEEYRRKLNDYVVASDTLNKDFVTTGTAAQVDDVTTPSLFTFEPKCFVDWDSPYKVVSVMKKLGFNTMTFDKEKNREKDTVLEKVIACQKGIADDFLDIYFGYKGACVNVKTFGQGHLNQINPNTGRIHTVFRQIGTVTGRMASGSNKANKDLAALKKLYPHDVKYCNLQNLPARGESGELTRSCFTATEGNAFVSCDYSAEESRVQADVWNEQTLLDSFKHGIDTHNLYAKMCFPEELKDVDVKDVKKVRPDLRQAAKSAEFAVGYGSDGSSIAMSIGMPVEKAKSMVQGILKGMPGMAAFRKKAAKFVKDHGFIVINNITGHRVYWSGWAAWKAEQDYYDSGNFWDEYRMYHKDTDDDVCRKVKKHIKAGHDWFNKNVLNYPIQGGSAIVLKQAAADLFKWVVENGMFGKILFCVFVHDEIDCECPKEMAEDFSKVMCNIMEQAAGKYYKRIKIPAEASIGDHWIH